MTDNNSRSSVVEQLDSLIASIATEVRQDRLKTDFLTVLRALVDARVALMESDAKAFRLTMCSND